MLHSKCFIGDKSKKKQDYHTEMNSEHFEEFFGEILEFIPEKSCIVIDMASYHRRITEESRNPTTRYRKQEIIDWLIAKEIDVPETYADFNDMTVPVLLNLSRLHKIDPVFAIEKMVEESGKDVKILWLPVAHCELNAIELVWSNVKGKNSLFTLLLMFKYYGIANNPNEL